MAPTPGQAAYERAHAAMRRRFSGIAPIAWDELAAEAQADWEDVAGEANSALNEAIAKVVAERDRLRGELAETREALALAMTPGALEGIAIIADDEELAGLRAENGRLNLALDVVSRRNLELRAENGRLGGQGSGPFAGADEWAVFWGGELPGECAGWDRRSR
jgi:hypothetical protein